MKVYSKTRKAHYWNEDRFINGSGCFVVLDGATPLKSVNAFNEARWLVDYIKRYFLRYKGSVKAKLAKLCGDAFYDLPSENKSAEYLPSAGAAWVELNGGTANIGILGDCEVTAVKYDGEVIRFYDGRLSELDGKAIEELVKKAKQSNIHIREALKYIRPTLIAHRKLINAPHGYSALTVSRDPVIEEKTFSISTEGLKSLYLYTDGFSQAFGCLKIYASHEEMFKTIESLDCEIEKIVKTSFSDRNLDLYPRFKVIDDITVTRIDF